MAQAYSLFGGSSERKKSAPPIPPRPLRPVGDVLCGQLASPDTTEQKMGFEAVEDLVKKLDPSVQLFFMDRLFAEMDVKATPPETYQALKNPHLKLLEAYKLYCKDAEKVAEIKNQYYQERKRLFERAKGPSAEIEKISKQLKDLEDAKKAKEIKEQRYEEERNRLNELAKKSSAALHKISKDLKKLEKQFPKKLAPLFDKKAKKAFQDALQMFYDHLTGGYELKVEQKPESLEKNKMLPKKLYLCIEKNDLVYYVNDGNEKKRIVLEGSLSAETARRIKAAISESKELSQDQVTAIYQITSQQGYSPRPAAVKFKNEKAWQRILGDVFKAVPQGFSDGFDFYNAKVPAKTVPVNASELDFLEAFESNPRLCSMDQCLFMGPKEGGANNPGEFGALYLRVCQDERGKLRFPIVFLKQATDDCMPNYREIIAEGMAGRLLRVLIGDRAAPTLYMVKPGGNPGNPADVLVGSIYFRNYRDIHHEGISRALKADKEAKQTVETDAKKNPPRKESLQQNVDPKTTKKSPQQSVDAKDKEKQPKPRVYGKVAGKGPFAAQRIRDKDFGHPNFPKGVDLLTADMDPGNPGKALAIILMASMAIIGNEQIHGENVGLADLVRNNALLRTFVLLDFGGAFRRLFTSKMIQLPGVGTVPKSTEENETGHFSRTLSLDEWSDKKWAANYLLAYSEKLRNSPAFLAGMDEVAHFDFRLLEEGIRRAVEYVVSFVGADAFVRYFAKELDTYKPELANVEDPQQAVRDATQFLIDTIFARQLSLREFVLRKKLESKPSPQEVMKEFPQNVLYLLLNKQFTGQAQSYLAQRDDIFQPLNVFIMQRISLQNSTDPATPDAMLTLLQAATVFINSNDLFYENELMKRCLQNIIAGQDSSLYAKATDEAYQVLRKIYEVVLKEKMFNTYFMKALAQALEKNKQEKGSHEGPEAKQVKSQQGPQRLDPKNLPKVFRAALDEKTPQNKEGILHLKGEDERFLKEQATNLMDTSPFIKRFFQCVSHQLFEFDVKGNTTGEFQSKLFKLKGIGVKQLREGMEHFGPAEFKLQLYSVLFDKLWDQLAKEMYGAERLRTSLGEYMQYIEGYLNVLDILRPYVKAGESKPASRELASVLSSAAELSSQVSNALEQVLRDPSDALQQKMRDPTKLSTDECSRFEKQAKDLVVAIKRAQDAAAQAAQEDAKKEKAAQPPKAPEAPKVASKGATDAKDPAPVVPANAGASQPQVQVASKNKLTGTGGPGS